MALSDAEINILIKARDEASGVINKISGLSKGMGTGLKVAGLAAAGGIGVAAFALKGFVQEAAASQKIMAQTNAVIASTKGAAGLSAKAIGDLADELSKVIPIDDEVIQATENMLLTFTNVGRDVFPEATEAALNMSIALGQDATQSAMQLGKALNDPIGGVTALRRVGVLLTDQQQDLIKSLVAAGDTMGAQKVILQELEVEFGKSGRAAGETFAGKMTILRTQIENVKESIGMALLPILSKLADLAIKHVVPAIESGARALTNFFGAISAALTGDLPRAAELFNELPKPLQELALWLGRNVTAIRDFGQAVKDAGKAIATDVLRRAGADLKAAFDVIQPALQWIIDHKPALVTAILAIGAALIVAFGPTASPILAVSAAIVGLALAVGEAKRWWEALTKANDEARQSNDESRKSAILLEGSLRVLGNAVKTEMIGLRGWVDLAVEGMYQLGRLEFFLLSNALKGISDQIGILHMNVTERWLPGIGAAWRALQYEVGWIPGFFTGMTPIFGQVVDSVQFVVERVYQLREAFYRLRDAISATIDRLNVFDDIPGLGKVLGALGSIVGAAETAVSKVVAVASQDVRFARGAAEGTGPERVGGRTRREWQFIFAAGGMLSAEYEAKLREMFGYRAGTAFVPNDGWAFLHRGEKVIPATQPAGAQTIVNNYYIQAAELHGDATAGFAAASGVFA